MSVSGPGPFDNDDAADWLGELEEEPGLDLLDMALDEVADPAHIGYVEISDCCIAVAASEILAQLLGKPGPEAPLTDETWSALAFEFRAQGADDVNHLVGKAVAAVYRVLRDEDGSELRQVWDADKGGMSAWTAAMQNLLARLRTIVAGRES